MCKFDKKATDLEMYSLQLKLLAVVLIIALPRKISLLSKFLAPLSFVQEWNNPI